MSLLILSLLLVIPAFSQNDSIIQRGKKFVYKGEHKLFRTRYDSIRNFSEGRAAVLRKGNWGFIDEQGEKIIKPQYKSVLDFNGGLAGCKSKLRNEWRIIDNSGKQVAYGPYDTVIYLDSFALAVSPNFFERSNTLYDIYHYYNRTGKCSRVDSIVKHGDLYLLVVGDDYGRREHGTNYIIMDSRATPITEKFRQVDSVLEKTVVITNTKNNYKAVLTSDGRVSAWYEKIGEDTNGFRIVSAWKYKGAINSRLQPIIGGNYEDVEYSGGQFLVRDKSMWTLHDTTGRMLTSGYNQFQHLGSGIYRAKNWKDTTWTLYNSHGGVIPGNYSEVNDFYHGLACALSADSSEYAYIDTSGKIVAGWYPCSRDFHYYGGGGFGATVFRIFMGIATAGISEIFYAAASGSSGSSGDGNKDTDIKGENGYYTKFRGRDFKNGYSVYTQRRKAPAPNEYKEEPVHYGLLDSTGKQLTKAEYRSIEPIDTFFIVEKSTGFGLITRNGKLILAPKYGPIHYVQRNYFRVERDDMSWFASALFYYDGKTGKFLSPFIYSEIKAGGDSTIIVQEYADYIYLDLNGKNFLRTKYKQAEPFKDGKAKVSFEYTGGEFYIDRKGKRVE